MKNHRLSDNLPDNRNSTFCTNKAFELYFQKQYKQSTRIFLQHSKQHPFNYETWINVSSCLIRQQKYTQSAHILEQRALSLKPYESVAYYNASSCYLKQEKYAKAIDFLKCALSCELLQRYQFCCDAELLRKAIEICGNNLEARKLLIVHLRLAYLNPNQNSEANSTIRGEIQKQISEYEKMIDSHQVMMIGAQSSLQNVAHRQKHIYAKESVEDYRLKPTIQKDTQVSEQKGLQEKLKLVKELKALKEQFRLLHELNSERRYEPLFCYLDLETEKQLQKANSHNKKVQEKENWGCSQDLWNHSSIDIGESSNCETKGVLNMKENVSSPFQLCKLAQSRHCQQSYFEQTQRLPLGNITNQPNQIKRHSILQSPKKYNLSRSNISIIDASNFKEDCSFQTNENIGIGNFYESENAPHQNTNKDRAFNKSRLSYRASQVLSPAHHKHTNLLSCSKCQIEKVEERKNLEQFPYNLSIKTNLTEICYYEGGNYNKIKPYYLIKSHKYCQDETMMYCTSLQDFKDFEGAQNQESSQIKQTNRLEVSDEWETAYVSDVAKGKGKFPTWENTQVNLHVPLMSQHLNQICTKKVPMTESLTLEGDDCRDNIPSNQFNTKKRSRINDSAFGVNSSKRSAYELGKNSAELIVELWSYEKKTRSRSSNDILIGTAAIRNIKNGERKLIFKKNSLKTTAYMHVKLSHICAK